MKRKTNKTKEEAWSQTAHAPDGEQPGAEASGTSGQSVPKSKFRKKSQQEQAAAAKLRMESQGEKLEQAREKLAKQKPPKKPGPVKRIGRVASGSVHSFVHGKIFEVEQENVGTEGAHRSELVGETALRYGSRFVRRKVREHPAKVVRKMCWRRSETLSVQKLLMTGGCIAIKRITLWTVTMALKMRS